MLSWCVWVCMDDVSVMLRSLVLVTTLLKIVFSMSCLLPLAVRVLGSRVFDVGWFVHSSFCLLFQGLCFNACNSELSWTQRAFREFQKALRRKATQHNRPPATWAIPKFTKRSTKQIQNGWIHRLADFTPVTLGIWPISRLNGGHLDSP